MTHTAIDRKQENTATVYVMTLLLVCSAGLNVMLSRDLRDSRAPVVRSLARNTPVPALTGRTLDGRPITFAFSGELPTVLYYFSAECGWCDRNWNNVNSVRIATRTRYRFIGVAASDSVPTYMRELDAVLPIVTGVSRETLDAFRFTGTPHTVVVGPDGRVLDSWIGAWQGPQAAAITRFFGVTLPGLTSAGARSNGPAAK
jgi:hypothetical protein